LIEQNLLKNLNITLLELIDTINIAEVRRIEKEKNYRWVQTRTFSDLLFSENPNIQILGVMSFANLLNNPYSMVLCSKELKERLFLYQYSKNRTIRQMAKEYILPLLKFKDPPSLETIVKMHLNKTIDNN